MIEDEPELWDTWRDFVNRPVIDHAYQSIFELIHDEIQREGPTCWVSGKCCKFDSYGHDLLATGFEIMWSLVNLEKQNRHFPEDVIGLVSMDGCPYQLNGQCSIHKVRPMGCRIYFCDKDHQDFQSPLYEKAIAQLKNLHNEYEIPYRLIEWRRGLAAAFKHLGHPDSQQLYNPIPPADSGKQPPDDQIDFRISATKPK